MEQMLAPLVNRNVWCSCRAVLLALTALCGTGYGTTITVTPGSYSFVTQPTLDGSMLFVPARDAAGHGVTITNGVVQTYTLPNGATDFTPIGRNGNIVFGNLGFGVNIIAATFDVSSNMWTQHAGVY